MRQAGGHLAERGQTITLLHAIVQLGVLEDDGHLSRHAAEQVDLVGRVGFAQPLVLQAQKAEHLIVGHERHAQRGVHLLESARHGVDGLGLGLRLGDARGVLALELLDRDRLPGRHQPLEEHAPGHRVDALDRPRPEVTEEVVAAAVRVDEVDRGVGGAVGLLDAGQADAHRFLDSITLASCRAARRCAL